MNKEIIDQILRFRNARDWEKFHTPENLAKSIAIESGELLEHFQWGDDVNIEALKEEIADVLMYTLLLVEAIDGDVEEIILNKLKKNDEKYPTDQVKGTSGRALKLKRKSEG